jgi:hypothetical protein
LEGVPHLVVSHRHRRVIPVWVALWPPQVRLQHQKLSPLQLTRSTHISRVIGPPRCCLVAVQPWGNVPRIRPMDTPPPLVGMAFNNCYGIHHPNSSLRFHDISVVERSEDNRSNTCHLSVVAFVSTPDGGSHTWEWSSTCCAPAAASIIALVAFLHGRSHGLSLHASRWGSPFKKSLNGGEGMKTLVSVIPSEK